MSNANVFVSSQTKALRHMNPKRLEGMDRSKEVVHISDTEQLTLQVNGGKVDENHSRILQNLITRKKKKKKKVKKKGKKCRGLKKAGKGGKGKKKKKKGGKGKKKKKGKYSKYKDDLCFDIQMCNTYSDIWYVFKNIIFCIIAFAD
jgi:hypothetical protein